MERTTDTGDAEGPSWAGVVGAFDARLSTPEQRGALIDQLYRKAMGQRKYWLSGAGEEAMWTWSAAAQAFTQGNWIAATLCCHAVCERALAGRFTSFWMDEDDAPARWQHMGLGRLLAELEKRDAIRPEAAEKLRRMAEYRKPFGHWKDFTHPSSLFERARSLLSEDNALYSEEAVLRLIVDDAARAIEITIEVLYGDPWGDTDRADAGT